MTLEKKLLHAKKSNDNEKLEIIFEEIYYEYFKLVGYIISKYVHKREDIEELVNDVFIKFSKVFIEEEFKSIKGYLVTLGKNEVLNFIKRKDQKEDIVYDDELIDNLILESNNNEGYYELVIELSKILNNKEVQIILLHSVYDYSFVEIGKKYGVSSSTISSIYHRSIKKFRKEVEK